MYLSKKKKKEIKSGYYKLVNFYKNLSTLLILITAAKIKTYHPCATILAKVFIASFEIINENSYISLFMMTQAILSRMT